MCFLLPKKIKKIEGKTVILEDGQKAKLGTTYKVKNGDYLLIYGNLAVGKITKNRARQIRKMLKRQRAN